MSVFTELSVAQLQALLADYDVGELTGHEGIPGGTDNTNYFLHTTGGEFVLTVLERVDAQAGEFAAALARHLLAHGLPCAAPVVRQDGTTFSTLHGKPAMLAPRLPGASVLDPSANDCAKVGTALAHLHRATMDFPDSRPNPYTVAWLAQARQQVASLLGAAQQRLYDEQLAALRREEITLPATSTG